MPHKTLIISNIIPGSNPGSSTQKGCLACEASFFVFGLISPRPARSGGGGGSLLPGANRRYDASDTADKKSRENPLPEFSRLYGQSQRAICRAPSSRSGPWFRVCGPGNARRASSGVPCRLSKGCCRGTTKPPRD